jgi:probable addiction module antidote protein
MNIKLHKWDVVEHLKKEQDWVLYLEACFEEDPGDGSLIRVALGDIAKARGMTQLAKDTGITREGLYKAFSKAGNPEFMTVLKVMRSLGLQLRVGILGIGDNNSANNSDSPIT